MTKVGLSVMLKKKRYLSNYIEEELKVVFNILVYVYSNSINISIYFMKSFVVTYLSYLKIE